MNNKELPEDIRKKIEELFPETPHRQEVKRIMEKIYDHDWGVGKDQLARALLILSNGKPELLEEHLENGDPRDLIMEAEAALGNPGHYFLVPFS